MTIEKLERAKELISMIDEQKRELNKFQVVRERLGLKVGSVDISFHYTSMHVEDVSMYDKEYHTLNTAHLESIEKMYDACISNIQDYINHLEKEFDEL